MVYMLFGIDMHAMKRPFGAVVFVLVMFASGCIRDAIAAMHDEICLLSDSDSNIWAICVPQVIATAMYERPMSPKWYVLLHRNSQFGDHPTCGRTPRALIVFLTGHTLVPKCSCHRMDDRQIGAPNGSHSNVWATCVPQMVATAMWERHVSPKW